MFYWGQPQFYGVRAAAANLGNSAGNYTAEQFQEDFPQFFTGLGESLLPRTMLDEFIRQANAAIQPDKWLDGWRYAAGLYTAHYATLYLKTYAPSSETPGQAAATGALVGVVASAKLGQDSVTYDTDALTKATEDWGDLNATQYGQLLATKARLVGVMSYEFPRLVHRYRGHLAGGSGTGWELDTPRAERAVPEYPLPPLSGGSAGGPHEPGRGISRPKGLAPV